MQDTFSEDEAAAWGELRQILNERLHDALKGGASSKPVSEITAETLARLTDH